MGQFMGCSCHQRGDLLNGRACPAEHGRACPADPITDFKDGDENLDFIAELDTVDLRGVGLSDLRLPPSGRSPGVLHEYKASSPWALRSVQRRLFQEMEVGGAVTIASDAVQASRHAAMRCTCTPDKNLNSKDAPKLALELGLQTPPSWQHETSAEASAQMCSLGPWQELEQHSTVVLVLAGRALAKLTKRGVQNSLARRRWPRPVCSSPPLRRALRQLLELMHVASSDERIKEEAHAGQTPMLPSTSVIIDMRRRRDMNKCPNFRHQVMCSLSAQRARCARKGGNGVLSGMIPEVYGSESASSLCRLNLGQHAVVKAAVLKQFNDIVTAI